MKREKVQKLHFRSLLYIRRMELLRILEGLFCEGFFECLCELVRAGCAATSAVGAFHSCDNVFGLHAFDELGDALCVAVATANEFCGFNGVVVCEGDLDLTGTGAFCGVFDTLCHNTVFLCFEFDIQLL